MYDSLEEIRQEIDQVDKEMTALFEKRMELVLQVAHYKSDRQMAILDSKREEEVIAKNISRLSSKNYATELRIFYQKLMDLAKKVQRQQLNQ